MHTGFWLVSPSDRKGPLGRTRYCTNRRILKTGLKGIGWNSTNWIHLAQDREKRSSPANTVMNLRVP